jgi:hypothetical protein
MKAISTSIFDFIRWNKFGYRPIPNVMIVDLLDLEIDPTELLEKTGFFEEENEVFFLEFDDSLFTDQKDSYLVSIRDVINIRPLTDTGRRALSSKIPEYNLAEPISPSLSKKLLDARNKHLALQGGRWLLDCFALEATPASGMYEDAYLLSLFKYLEDLNSERTTIADNVLFYERSKPFPLVDIGFFYDIGSITKSIFYVSDEDLKNKQDLMITDHDKFEKIESMLALSKFLQVKHAGDIWNEYIEASKTTAELRSLSNHLAMNAVERLDNILIIGFYLKIRYMIRNGCKPDQAEFTKTIDYFLSLAREEASISLTLAGMFFGFLKFKELYYSRIPLNIAIAQSGIGNNGPKMEYANESKCSPLSVSEGNSQDLRDSFGPGLNIDINEPNSGSRINDNRVFDELLWNEFSGRFPKMGKGQLAILEKCFFSVIKSKDYAISDRPSQYLKILEKKVTESQDKKSTPKLTVEIFAAVQSIISIFFRE